MNLARCATGRYEGLEDTQANVSQEKKKEKENPTNQTTDTVCA
jgi:hypothetical protein